MRWLPREDAPNGYRLPLQAVGAIVYAFRPPGSLDLQAVALEAIGGKNGRVLFPNDAKRKAYGQKKGAVFAVGIAGGDPLVIVEGEADALAGVWFHPGAEVWAGGGTSGANLAPAIPQGREVVIEADPDATGRKAALKLDAALGDRARIEWNRNGQDTAEKWRAELLERAGILKFDGGLDQAAADRAAWDRPLQEREQFSNRREKKR